jgi:hypothetical protein
MTQAATFPFVSADAARPEATQLPYIPLILRAEQAAVETMGLLDTGATVNVLPYRLGLHLGMQWNPEAAPIQLTGNLASYPAQAVVITGRVKVLHEVRLAFAWTQASHVPLILGQINFFLEFNVCFLRSQNTIEITSKT